MAAGKINLQKASGGVTAITGVDGVGNTELVLPESGTVARTSDINTAGVELKTIATGTATFNSTTNNINLTGIGIGVEIGDVIQISGAEDAKNNSEFTIEVITNDNNIIVNQAHANKGTTKNVATRASDTGVTVKLLAKWYNASDGLGQDWVNVTSSRARNTLYANNTNRKIEISAILIPPNTGNAVYVEINSNGIAQSYMASTVANTSIFATAGKGANYKFTGTDINITIGVIWERR